MAKAYIDIEELLTTLEDYIEYDTFDIYQEEPLINMSFEQLEDIVTSQPTADAVEVVHGEWESYPNILYRRCSVCKTEYYTEWNRYKGKYCPNCGAKMNGKKVE